MNTQFSLILSRTATKLNPFGWIQRAFDDASNICFSRWGTFRFRKADGEVFLTIHWDDPRPGTQGYKEWSFAKDQLDRDWQPSDIDNINDYGTVYQRKSALPLPPAPPVGSAEEDLKPQPRFNTKKNLRLAKQFIREQGGTITTKPPTVAAIETLNDIPPQEFRTAEGRFFHCGQFIRVPALGLCKVAGVVYSCFTKQEFLRLEVQGFHTPMTRYKRPAEVLFS